MLEKMLKYLVAGTAGLALGCSPVDSERLGCISDDDCKGDRECVQGECVTSALDAYVGVEEVASCSLDKYVCIDEKTVGALDTCGLTSLYSKCLDSEICSSGECVDKPCEEFTGDSFYEGFDGPLDPCKWEYSEGNKGEIIDGYWVSGEGQGIIKAKYDPGCEDFTLSMRGRITVKDSEHQSLGFVYNGIGLGMGYNNEIDKSSITMQCPVGSNKTDGLDFFNFH